MVLTNFELAAEFPHDATWQDQRPVGLAQATEIFGHDDNPMVVGRKRFQVRFNHLFHFPIHSRNPPAVLDEFQDKSMTQAR